MPCELRRRQDASTAPATTIDGTGFAAIQKKLHSSTNLLPSALSGEPYCLLRRDVLSRGQAKIAQKVKAGASGDVIVPTDSFTTACAQACPAGAIVFGNLNDPESRVSKLKKLDRDYTVLEFLLTKPRLTYLAKVRNPNPAMPDYQPAGPLSFQAYEQKMGDPFEQPPSEAHGATAEPAAEKGAR